MAVPALVFASLSFAPRLSAEDATPRRDAPELPSSLCDAVNVPDGHRLSFQMFAEGVQIYRWSGATWVFVAPEARLFADRCQEASAGTHYAGPTWEANDGSKVMATVQARCAPAPGAVPWLLLAATSASGYGDFGLVTYIQRIHTIGGTAPAEAGVSVGEEARVPYSAEYYFYRARAPRGDAVTDWNTHLEEMVFATAQPVPAQPRSAAIMHLAMFDAINGIDRRYTPYYVTSTAPPGARQEAAAAHWSFLPPP